jgi:hypothetical protein
MRTRVPAWLIACLLLPAMDAVAGLDHQVTYDNSGIWNRSNQNVLRCGALITDIGIAVGLRTRF